MRSKAVLILVGVAWLGLAGTAASQEARAINPEAVEFDTPLLTAAGLTGYRVELFAATADPTRDKPIKTMELKPDALRSNGRVRVELTDLVRDIPDGQYVTTIRALTPGQSAQSKASDTFFLRREETLEERIEEGKRERFWNWIGVAIGAGIIFIPIIF